VPKALLHKLFNADIPLTRLLNGASELEYLRPIKAGDTIAVTARLTRLRQMPGAEGPTLFMFTETTFANQRGEVVVKGKNTYIKY
jgi:acyl dehydratase